MFFGKVYVEKVNYLLNADCCRISEVCGRKEIFLDYNAAM